MCVAAAAVAALQAGMLLSARAFSALGNVSRVFFRPQDQRDAEKAATQAAASFAATNHAPQGAKAWRVFALRQGAMAHTEETLQHMRRLVNVTVK